MKLPVYNLEGKKASEIDIGEALSKPVRLDIINRCVLAEQSFLRQPYGSDYWAGKRTSAHYHGERGTRYSMMNKEMARLRRIHGNQGYLSMTARFSPQAIKGRQAHPPKPEKVWLLKVNKREKILGLLSSLSATSDKSLVSGRGHLAVDMVFPIVVEDKLEGVKNTKNLVDLITNLGLAKEIERASVKKVRAGSGKNRGRRYKKKVGPLVVVKEDKGILKAVKNLAGFDGTVSTKLSVSMLAPGGQPGRLAIFTQSALQELLTSLNGGIKGKNKV